MENKEIARLLSETADLMEVAGEDAFRIRSYRNGAAAVASYPERITDLLCNPDRKVTEIAGIGKGLASVIAEICQRGTFERREQMLSKYPASALELLKIQGLGPKSIALLYEHHGVKTVDDLERICREQKLRELPRMGAKLEEKVLRSIEAYRKTAGRFLLSFGRRVADELRDEFLALPGIENVEAAGSLRRGRETIGDLDLLVTGPGSAETLNRLVKHPKAFETLGLGANKASVKFGVEHLQVDVRALSAENFGAALQYFTGSKEHNVVLRTNAIKRGLTLNEYGLFAIETNERVAGGDEEEVYRRLGYDWIPPELRENCGELEAAQAHLLPKLLELTDIRGDLHMHTTATDGKASLREMADAAAARGYQYIAITDHSKALAMSNGLDEKRVVEFAQEVRELNRDGLPLRIFSGLECDILRDGAMDIAEDALVELDLVIGSVHSYMNLEPPETTDRLLRALDSPSLRILGHLTGRLLLQRESYVFDFDRVAAKAAERGVCLEVNASPERLDLPSHLVRTAKRKGCRFTISTDAHRTTHLDNMRFGVITARRGWLEASDVLNTKPLAEFEAAIKARS
ncbi:MAG: DNA polymerase/3'-5' exonuclease PolX [Acidobacteriaceae bacterium]|nr:DNA polymerase/3'-5' exonuclease PolX [Acidobacteriaceae bacterium]MBV9780079.1 DNA polymerase/3'-5' exonuclease PolX [Acidobacteriaceae bacterium]